MTSCVYLLVEKNHFKIGKAINPAKRARMVVPKLFEDSSWVIEFSSDKDAVRCEKTLHWMFRTHRLPQMDRDGGTEFFNISAINEVILFIENNKSLLGYQRFVKWAELLKSNTSFEPSPDLSGSCINIKSIRLDYVALDAKNWQLISSEVVMA